MDVPHKLRLSGLMRRRATAMWGSVSGRGIGSIARLGAASGSSSAASTWAVVVAGPLTYCRNYRPGGRDAPVGVHKLSAARYQPGFAAEGSCGGAIRQARGHRDGERDL